MQLEKINEFFLVYSVILGIFWVTLSSKHMWGSVQVIWMILACATFIYHPTWASCSEIQYPQTWWDIFFFKYSWLLWQFPDLRVQPGSYCGRPMWHYKRLKIFSKMSVSRQILCWIVGKSQNTLKPFVLNFLWNKNVFLLIPPAVLVIIEDISNFQEFLSFIKFIKTPFKRVSKVPELYVGKSQNKGAYHKKINP